MAFFSSSPVQAQHAGRLPSISWNSSLFDAPQASSVGCPPSSPSSGFARPTSKNGVHTGQLSPTFDQTFQSSMNISGLTPEDDDDNGNTTPLEHGDPLHQVTSGHKEDLSPHAMDISPAPASTSTFAFNPVPTAFASSNSLAKPSASSSKPFDNSFFAKLTANQPGSATSGVQRSRTRSADVQPLAEKDGNEQPAPNFPLKRPLGLLRTASAAAKANPFEVSPRFPGSVAAPVRPGLLERARSDGGLVFGAAKQATRNGSESRPSSGLGKEASSSLVRPAPGPYPLQSGSGRRISGSSRVRSALPTEWSSNRLDVPLAQPPRLCHTLSAPIVKPLDWGHLTSQKSSSDSAVPTRRTLGTDHGSRLAREVLNASQMMSSPNGMDVDPSSPQTVGNSHRNSRQAVACSPGLGDLFEENGVDLSSPEAGIAAITSRKRGAVDDPDSSLNEIDPGSPAQLASNTLASKPRPRALHRATSAAVLGSSSASGSGSWGRRPAGSRSGSGTWAPGVLAKKAAAQEDSSSSARHRKVSRGADGKPTVVRLGAGRRAQSMCDSEFYASPPLGGPEEGPSNSSGYFGMSHPTHSTAETGAGDEELEELHEGSGYLAPPQDLLSPPRPMLAPNQLKTYQPSPEANMKAGFGETEMKGKILPCFPVANDGLMRISPATLHSLLAGDYDEQIDAYCVIDCRFEYEFAGGHVEGAINLSNSQAIESFLLSCGPDSLFSEESEMPFPTRSGEVCPQGGHKRKTVLIFHCEFSAKRAPTLAGHLRCRDRTINAQHYPAVHYPDVYVLHGGYADYYRQYPDTCDPRGYTPMDDPEHLKPRSKGIAELRKNRIGLRTQSYTYGMRSDQVRAQLEQDKGTSGQVAHAARPASSSFLQTSMAVAGSSRPTSSGSLALFKGVMSSKLTVQHEGDEHGEEDEAGESSAEGENSFTATKHGLLASAGLADAGSSSPFAEATGSPGMPLQGSKMLMMMGVGDSPCALTAKPKPMIHTQLFQQSILNQTKGKAGNSGISKPGRGFQRSYTSTGGMFG